LPSGRSTSSTAAGDAALDEMPINGQVVLHLALDSTLLGTEAFALLGLCDGETKVDGRLCVVTGTGT
jgi:hypothetical protein